MKRVVIRHVGVLVGALLCISSPHVQAQVSVTTYHNDNARTGQNTQEATLTPTNVNSSEFGKLFTVTVDGWVYAQPLYLSNVNIAGGTHNVLYVATEHDSLYAIDADKGTIYWQISLIPSGGSTVNSSSDLGCGDLFPEIGITGTPVIDTGTGTIYLVAKSKVNGSVVQYLHAIDVVASVEKFGGPMLIQASVPGTASDGDGTTVSFNPFLEHQRASLLLENGHVVIGWGSHCDISPWHGWVMSYSASTLGREAAFNTSADGGGNGVWMGGGGLAADSNGNIFFATGNGTWNGTTDYGDSIVKLGPPSGGSFPVLDYFTPYNQGSLYAGDADVASGGLVLLPALSSGQQLLTQMGKEGRIYLIDRNNMGKYCVNQTPACNDSNPNIVQEIPGATVGVWGAPAYWNGSVYWGSASDGGAADNLTAFSFNANNSGLISTSPTSESAKIFSFPAPSPSVSASGNSNGIVWGLDDSAVYSTCSNGVNCQVLYAYDATNLENMLYNSGQAANNRDVPGGAVKFATPTIANGKVYVGSQYAVSAYGEIGSAAPVITSGTTASGTVGSAFSYQITATNSPTGYGATGLPAGLAVSSTTGLISGTPTTAGTATVTLSATNGTGTGNATLTLTIATTITASSVQVIANASSGTVNSFSLSFPQNTVAGDLIMVAFDYDTNSTPSSVTDTQGNTFTTVGSQLTTPGQTRSRVYYAKNIKGGADTVTVKLSANSGWMELYLIEYTGVDPSNPIDVQVGGAGNAGGVTSGNATTTAGDDLIFGFCVADWACTAGPGFTVRSTYNHNLVEDEVAGSPGNYAATGTANNGWSMQMVALKPAQ